MLAELILFSENPAVMLADYRTESNIQKGLFRQMLKSQKIAAPFARMQKETAKYAKIRAFRGFRTPRTGIEPAAFRLGGEPSILLRYRGLFNFEMKKAALQRMV